MPNFKIIGLMVLEDIFEGFYKVWTGRPSWSCYLDPLSMGFHMRSGYDWSSGLGEEDL